MLVKNWLGRKGLQYLEMLTAAEKETCNTWEVLFDTLSSTFKPQDTETIKSLQLRKLYQHEDENMEEWMGQLQVAAVQCNYQEIDRQLKEQIIHGINNKHMLEKIIKELTVTSNDDNITSGGVLAWEKRVETQRQQAAVLNTIKELKQFNKKQVSKKAKEVTTRAQVGQMLQQQPC